ncbi:MAG: hypothetical protein HQM10_08690 [Candidatus Riflebacteria bacterium]|nr:hypothetical protein [Candidatus Riflebacteria bacterium]
MFKKIPDKAAIFAFCFMTALNLQAQPALVVDTRLMLLAHPLVHLFDPSSKRFRNTPSEPVDEGNTGVEKIRSEAEKVGKQLEELPQKYSEKIENAKSSKKAKLMKEFLEKKAYLENHLDLLMKRSNEAISVPGRIGMTPYSSILPTVQLIAQEIRETTSRLSKKYNSGCVIDVSSLAPLSSDQIPDSQSDLLKKNMHFSMNTEPTTASAELFSWLDTAKNYWAKRNFKIIVPVLYGGKDVRIEAAEIIAKRSSK